MSLGYTRVIDVKDLGGFVVPNLLSPEFQAWDANDEVLGKYNELTIVDTDQAVTPNPVFRLPLVRGQGQVCAVKNINPIAELARQITVLPSGNDELLAGIGSQQIDSMVFVGNVGECAFFVSTDFGVVNQGGGWLLVSYLIGSTFAP